MTVLSAEALLAWMRALFAAAGLSAEHAATVAEVLVWADLRGVETHGVLRVPRYLEMITEGTLNAKPKMTLRTETAAAALIDADRAAGPVAMIHATEEALRRAAAVGIGLSILRRTTHTGALGYYTRIAAERAAAALAFAASGPNMIYHGARRAGVSTSPLSIAVPGGGAAPIVLDMAAGVVTMGRLIAARRSGERLPPGAAVDAAGEPTTDPAAAVLPLPLGGPKGSGLALMFECLASLLGAHPILADALTGEGEGRRHRQNAFVIAIDIARFCDLAFFRREVKRLVAALKALPRQAETAEILIPGERGDRMRARRLRDGIPLSTSVRSELLRVSAALGVTPAPGA